MNIYVFVEIVLALLVIISDKGNRKIVFFVSAALLLMLTCLNDGTGDVNHCGYDLPEYIKFFKGELSAFGSLAWRSYYDLEWPYFYYCKFLRLIGDTDFVYIAGSGLFFGLPFLYVVYKKSPNPALSIFILLTIFNTWTYLFFLAAHRQMLANTFIFLAYIFIEAKYKLKYYMAFGCIVISLFCHSSSYFVVPLLLFTYFYKFNLKKKTKIKMLVITFILGFVMSYVTTYLLTNLFSSLESIDTVARSASYVPKTKSFTGDIRDQLPFFINMLFLFYFSNNKSNQFFQNCLFITACLYNLLYMIPLINRGLTTFLLMSIAGAIPINTKRSKYYRYCLITILAMNTIVAYFWYQSYYCRIVPFRFIWE